MACPNPQVRPYGPAVIQDAAASILAGGIVAVPTETVYGLAADATNAEAAAAIYTAKGRPSFNPLIVHVLDLVAAERIAVFDDDARVLAAAFWPGPLTLVLPLRAQAGIASLVTAGLETVAIRAPAGRAMRDLLAVCGRPLAAPSANASNAISPTTAAHVVASLGNRVPLVVDDGACAAGVESTIVSGRAILRPGPVTAAMVAGCFSTPTPPPGEGRGPVATNSVTARSADHDRPATGPRPLPEGESGVNAPGQLASHYAPRKPLRLNATSAAPDEWLIGYGATPGDETLGNTPVEAAANLFAALHRADATPAVRIAVAPIPEYGIGVAINDRLRRAAHR
ncbi:L-threonylcarbamoyladenylate synthase [Sphingomonas bacterium]|uniref:L-threonylcarbamoyladenylate synthase n=1 Tax=Sphingomonas bacterium TaxID=1895847 RepID=UPI0015757E20|nr:L-threonylcarbamoyladenylate synthase [Sphingomonas bacterium]